MTSSNKSEADKHRPGGQQFPDYTRTVAVKYVRRGLMYVCRYATSLLLVPLAASLALELANMYSSGKLTQLWAVASEMDLTVNLVTVVSCCSVLVAVLLAIWMLQTRPVYIVDYSVYRCPDSWTVSKSRFRQIFEPKGFKQESIEFMEKVLNRSGLGETTYAAPTMTGNPQDLSLEAARAEFEFTAYKAIADALNKTGINPRQIGIVINNSSLFNTTPSLSASIMNHFKMSSKTINYNLGGMGCSAGVVAIDLARQMLQLYPNTYALVVSTENNTHNWYKGNDRSMLVTTTLFRVGASAVILSNKRSDSWRAKYKLQHVVRTNLAANDAAYKCIYEQEDEEGHKGVSLSKQLMGIAGEAIKANITTLGPLVLPLSEQLLFAGNLIARKVLGKKALKAYLPDFKQAFEHFVIHTGGRGVLDEIEKQLALAPAAIEPSRACLWRFGNVSSGSIWYVLAYIETFRGVKRGDRVWQLAFGSGFKCNSAVWVANRRIMDKHAAWDNFDLATMRNDLAAI